MVEDFDPRVRVVVKFCEVGVKSGEEALFFLLGQG